MFISASMLVKHSAAGLVYLRLNKKETEITDQMLLGEEFQKQNTESNLVEMGGKFKTKSFTIAYSIDEIRTDNERLICYEHKMAIDPDKWFFESSLIQTAFYAAMLKYETRLMTSKFQREKSETLILKLDGFAQRSFILNFGGTHYRIFNKYPEDLIMFYVRKAVATRSYETGRAFDALYKHKEYPLLKHYFNYEKIRRVK
jgi:hypothetical protein